MKRRGPVDPALARELKKRGADPKAVDTLVRMLDSKSDFIDRDQCVESMLELVRESGMPVTLVPVLSRFLDAWMREERFAAPTMSEFSRMARRGVVRGRDLGPFIRAMSLVARRGVPPQTILIAADWNTDAPREGRAGPIAAVLAREVRRLRRRGFREGRLVDAVNVAVTRDAHGRNLARMIVFLSAALAADVEATGDRGRRGVDWICAMVREFGEDLAAMEAVGSLVAVARTRVRRRLALRARPLDDLVSALERVLAAAPGFRSERQSLTKEAARLLAGALPGCADPGLLVIAVILGIRKGGFTAPVLARLAGPLGKAKPGRMSATLAYFLYLGLHNERDPSADRLARIGAQATKLRGLLEILSRVFTAEEFCALADRPDRVYPSGSPGKARYTLEGVVLGAGVAVAILDQGGQPQDFSFLLLSYMEADPSRCAGAVPSVGIALAIRTRMRKAIQVYGTASFQPAMFEWVTGSHYDAADLPAVRRLMVGLAREWVLPGAVMRVLATGGGRWFLETDACTAVAVIDRASQLVHAERLLEEDESNQAFALLQAAGEGAFQDATVLARAFRRAALAGRKGEWPAGLLLVEAAAAAPNVGGLGAALGFAGEIASARVFPTRNLIIQLAAAETP